MRSRTRTKITMTKRARATKCIPMPHILLQLPGFRYDAQSCCDLSLADGKSAHALRGCRRSHGPRLRASYVAGGHRDRTMSVFGPSWRSAQSFMSQRIHVQYHDTFFPRMPVPSFLPPNVVLDDDCGLGQSTACSRHSRRPSRMPQTA